MDSTAQGSGERRDTLQVHVVWYTRQGPYHTLPDSQKPKPMTWLNGINNSTDMNLNKTQVLVMDRSNFRFPAYSRHTLYISKSMNSFLSFTESLVSGYAHFRQRLPFRNTSIMHRIISFCELFLSVFKDYRESRGFAKLSFLVLRPLFLQHLQILSK